MPLLETPEAPEIAARYGVAPEIHAADHMFGHHLAYHPGPEGETPEARRSRVLEYHFSDGARSAARLDELVARYHPAHGRRRLHLLEFASGYGWVSRHLAKMQDRYELLACDIHEDACRFLQETLHVAAIPSDRDPARLNLPRAFDVIFALSFFTHMPDRTWGPWLRRLFDALADDGLLIFTTHGRISHDDANRVPLHPDGYWFGGTSEQKDLPPDDYSTMFVTPSYVFEQLEPRDRAALAMFEESSWWGKQDTYVVRKVPLPFRREAPGRLALRDEVAGLQAMAAASRAEAAALRDGNAALRAENAGLRAEVASLKADGNALQRAIETIRASRSWRLTEPVRRVGRLIGRR